MAKLGGIDILVNNAGVLTLGSIEDFKLTDLDQTLAINVRAVFVATLAAIRHMKEGGRIINIGSTNAERVPSSGSGVYAMSKSALKGPVQGLARDLEAWGITINNVQPGPIVTEMNPSNSEFAEMLRTSSWRCHATGQWRKSRGWSSIWQVPKRSLSPARA